VTVHELLTMKVPAAPDCVLFLWATVPMLCQALGVMGNWGFTYKSHFIWLKDRMGTGYWNRNQHELLLVGTRGDIPAPAPGTQYPSVIDAPVTGHSAKPHHFAEMIEELFPNQMLLEMFARGPRLGWTVHGNETD
jgi:N6-adenosine-specific RNA methylase IME4